MKKLIYFIIITLFSLSACQNQAEKTSGKVEQEKTTEQERILVLPYEAGYNEKTQKLELKHNSQGDASKLSIADMIEAINIKYPEIKLQFIKTSHDTVHVKIANATYLNENLGIAGAKAYMAEATYAMSEIAGIRAVNFIFIEGNHASPGIYTRESF